MASLHGPHSVSSQMQVKLPIKLARALHLEPGDEFFWRISDDDPSVLLLIPSEVVERRYSAGADAEDQQRVIARRLETAPADASASGT